MKIIFVKVEVACETRRCIDENNTCISRSWADDGYHKYWYKTLCIKMMKRYLKMCA